MSKKQKQPYMKFFASDWLVITRALTPSEAGVLIKLISMMHESGPLEDDNRILARPCGCSTYAFGKAKDALLKERLLTKILGNLWSPVIDRWTIMAGRQPLSSSIRTFVFERDGKTCAYCGATDGDFHIDHVIPVALGGTNDLENLRVACSTCNLSKGAKSLEEWLQ